MRIYAYLRASTKEQDANRARSALQNFADEFGHTISTWFTENESGATLKRPELFRLLDVAQDGDVLLVEQVDRISRLNNKDWEILRNRITSKGIAVVALDLPTSHIFLKERSNDFTDWVTSAINGMMLDMLAAISRKDYEDRRSRQAEGIAKGKANGKYKGRQINKQLHENIRTLLQTGKSYREKAAVLNCSLPTITKVNKAMREQETIK